MVVDHPRLPVIGGGDLVGDPGESVEAVFSPYRTCVGVVAATSLALAAARGSGGEFVDIEVGLLEEQPVSDPAEFIAMTRLARSGRDGFEARCEAYLRQFANLRGWPRDVSTVC